MTRLTAALLTLTTLVAPLPSHADDTRIPVPNPRDKAETIRAECERKYSGDRLGSIKPSTYCKVVAWSEIGQHYPDLLKTARDLERRYNQRGARLQEAREQLRRERQQTDKLAERIGQQQAEIDRQMPRWIAYVASAGAILVGGAIGYGIGQL